MIVDTYTDIALDTIQFGYQRELLADLIKAIRSEKPIKLGSVALVVLEGLQSVCDEIHNQNNLDCEPECPGCTNPGLCEDCEYPERSD